MYIYVAIKAKDFFSNTAILTNIVIIFFLFLKRHIQTIGPFQLGMQWDCGAFSYCYFGCKRWYCHGLLLNAPRHCCTKRISICFCNQLLSCDGPHPFEVSVMRQQKIWFCNS